MRPRPLVVSLLLLLLVSTAVAGDLRITLPKRSKPTPVQKFNQEGVKAIKKHKYEEARRLFYKAYLLDPNDPFTLNNLGYISELSGDVERAQRFYSLAAEMASDATIDQASSASAKGKSVAEVAGKTEDLQVQINRYNVRAIGLLMQDRAPEADLVLQRALELDRKNAFTLNNMGFAKEKEGEYEAALSYYSAAAGLLSQEPIVVTPNRSWRGKGISEVAADNAHKLRNLMEKQQTVEMRVARLNLQGVSAMNRNDKAAARRAFEQAYRLAPTDSFTLNNMGYLAEMDGDRETATFYYAKAQEAERNNAKVAVATRKELEGRQIRNVAEFGETKVDARMEAARRLREREGGPVLLKSRDGRPIVDPDRPPEPPKSQSPVSIQNEPLPPLPDDQQPSNAGEQPSTQPPRDVLPPLPEDQQPGAARPTQQQQQQQPVGEPKSEILPPLPDNQQPDIVRQQQSDQPQQQPTTPGNKKTTPAKPPDRPN